MDGHLWDEAWLEDREKSIWDGADSQSDCQQIDLGQIDFLQPNPQYNEHSFETQGMTAWPPSLIAAAESRNSQPSQTVSLPTSNVFCSESTPSSDASNTAADVPFSFHNRMLQLAGPSFDPTAAPLFAETTLPYYHGSQRIDSVAGSLDNQFDSADECPAGLVQSRASSGAEDYGSVNPPMPLQYHLIQMTSRPTRGGMLQTENRCEHEQSTTSPTQKIGTLQCDLCTDRKFTGKWAPGNLRRHMRQEHSNSSSPEGPKAIRCSDENCDSTFSRPDALLVHERRSHPELHRPPPNKKPSKKRKRSEEF